MNVKLPFISLSLFLHDFSTNAYHVVQTADNADEFKPISLQDGKERNFKMIKFEQQRP